MSTSDLLIVVAALLAVTFIIAVLAMRSGPRVTTIETKREDRDPDA